MIPYAFMVLTPRITSYCGLLNLLYSTISGDARYLLLSEYSKKFSSISAFLVVWNLPLEVFHDYGTSLFVVGSSMGLSLSTKIRSPSDPESNRTRTNSLLLCLLLRWQWRSCLDLPLITATMAVVLPSGGSLSGVIFSFLSNLPFWSDDVIMMSLASLTDAVLTSLELLAIISGVALIRLGGV